MAALEVIAGIFALLILVKLVFVIFGRKSWDDMIDGVLKYSGVWAVIVWVLLVMVFYFLVSSLSIVEIFAVMAFAGLFMGLGLLKYPKEFAKFKKAVSKKKLSAVVWIYIVVWAAISVWVLVEIF